MRADLLVKGLTEYSVDTWLDPTEAGEGGLLKRPNLRVNHLFRGRPQTRLAGNLRPKTTRGCRGKPHSVQRDSIEPRKIAKRPFEIKGLSAPRLDDVAAPGGAGYLWVGARPVNGRLPKNVLSRTAPPSLRRYSS